MRIDPDLKKRIKKHISEKLSEEKRQTVVLKTPYPASNEELASIYAKFPDLKECKMQNEVETSLIGGFILQYRSKIVDASLKTKLSSVVDTLIS